jgi:serine/threonine protein kinase
MAKFFAPVAERQGKSTVRARPGRGEDFAWAKERFIEEARILARFDHPNIVRVARVFSANNTAYIVEDFQSGRSLKEWLRDLDEPPTQAELDLLLTPILDALSTIHANDILHRDLAPDNIYVCDDGSPVLLDFGSAREAIAQRTKTISSVVKTGYSPPEQYSTTGKSQGPWTDIYALGATLYHAVAGKPPDEASDRVLTDDLVPATRAARRVYRAGFLEAIDWALRVDTKRRPQSVSDWRKALLDDRGSFERAAAAPTP